jgi:CBS-domain-containing membrane protein
MPTPSIQKQAQRLRIYIGESDRWRGKPLYAVLLDILKAQGMAGATVLRGVAGFGAHSHIHTAAILRLSEDLPLVIDVIDNPDKISAALEIIYPMVNEGLITIEDVQVIKYTHRYLHPLPADRLVSEVMTRAVITLSPETAVYAAWMRMLESQIKVFPVVDDARHVLGILTDEDLLERAGIQQRLAVAARLNQTLINEELDRLRSSPFKVADVMSYPVITACADDPLGLAASRMVKAGLKRLPVVDGQGLLVGILARLDILRQVADNVPPVVVARSPAPVALTVQDVMTVDVPLVRLEDRLEVLVEKFLSAGTHRLVVVDQNGRAVGLISDSDVVARVQPAQQAGLLAAFRKIAQPPAGHETAADLMSPRPLAAAPDLPLVDAVQLMLSEGRKWLVVVDAQSHPLGLVDRRILLDALTSH